jgi:hypothetical protein
LEGHTASIASYIQYGPLVPPMTMKGHVVERAFLSDDGLKTHSRITCQEITLP